jgi:hypothetical protein
LVHVAHQAGRAVDRRDRNLTPRLRITLHQVRPLLAGQVQPGLEAPAAPLVKLIGHRPLDRTRQLRRRLWIARITPPHTILQRFHLRL